jgi:signal transduction histidine kinase
VKKCLDLQGGKISIDSKVGGGTIVIINIPLIDDEPKVKNILT